MSVMGFKAKVGSLKVCSHRAKANMKAIKIKEQLEEIKEQIQTSKTIFGFAWSEHCFICT